MVMARFLYSVGIFALNAWFYMARHAIHDTGGRATS